MILSMSTYGAYSGVRKTQTFSIGFGSWDCPSHSKISIISLFKPVGIASVCALFPDHVLNVPQDLHTLFDNNLHEIQTRICL